MRSNFLKIFGSKSELKYHLFRVQIDGKRLCLQEKGLEIVKNSVFRGQNKVFLILIKNFEKKLTKLDLRRS